MHKEHHYKTNIIWTGNKGTGTSRYDQYERSHTVKIENKPDIIASSDLPFRGEGHKHNPEDFFLSALSSCHMLWYLHLCADAGVVVEEYSDEAEGTMIQLPSGGGHFTEVTLHPTVIVQDAGMIEKANEIHALANQKCFIANSVNFKVKHLPKAMVKNQ